MTINYQTFGAKTYGLVVVCKTSYYVEVTVHVEFSTLQQFLNHAAKYYNMQPHIFKAHINYRPCIVCEVQN